MHVLIKNNAVEKYPYSVNQLRLDNPNVSFPANPPAQTLKEYGVFLVTAVEPPDYNTDTHAIEDGTPVLKKGVWTQVWNSVALTPEQVAQRLQDLAADREIRRADAYRTKSDPLFFKWQRGEATEQQWLDKVAEIKAAYP